MPLYRHSGENRCVMRMREFGWVLNKSNWRCDKMVATTLLGAVHWLIKTPARLQNRSVYGWNRGHGVYRGKTQKRMSKHNAFKSSTIYVLSHLKCTGLRRGTGGHEKKILLSQPGFREKKPTQPNPTCEIYIEFAFFVQSNYIRAYGPPGCDNPCMEFILKQRQTIDKKTFNSRR